MKRIEEKGTEKVRQELSAVEFGGEVEDSVVPRRSRAAIGTCDKCRDQRS